LAEREDEEVSAIIEETLSADGVEIMLGQTIVKVKGNACEVNVLLANGSRIEGSHILIATGRTPNSDQLGLERVGVRMDARGFIETDEYLRTSVAGIWALGDVNGRGAFTHTSYHDHEIVLAQIDGLKDLHQWRDASARPVTYAMFTDPPLGRVGMSLAEARSAAHLGRNILVAERSMSAISRAKEESETAGLIRLIVDGDTEQFLGATVFGISGDEIIGVITNYMATGAGYRMMRQALPVHPTVGEFLPTILADLKRLGT